MTAEMEKVINAIPTNNFITINEIAFKSGFARDKVRQLKRDINGLNTIGECDWFIISNIKGNKKGYRRIHDNDVMLEENYNDIVECMQQFHKKAMKELVNESNLGKKINCPSEQILLEVDYEQE